MNHPSTSAKCGRAFEKALTLFEDMGFDRRSCRRGSLDCAPGRSWGEVSTRACTFCREKRADRESFGSLYQGLGSGTRPLVCIFAFRSPPTARRDTFVIRWHNWARYKR
jgi:hypothetical protein